MKSEEIPKFPYKLENSEPNGKVFSEVRKFRCSQRVRIFEISKLKLSNFSFFSFVLGETHLICDISIIQEKITVDIMTSDSQKFRAILSRRVVRIRENRHKIHIKAPVPPQRGRI